MDDPCAKSSSSKENDRIAYVVSCMKGGRETMQDFHTAILDLDGSDSTSLFAVFDGHGGDKVASYCSKRFHVELVKDPEYQNAPSTALEHVNIRIDERLKRSDKWMKYAGNGRFLSHLKTGLRAVRRIFKWGSQQYIPPQQEGTTACVALIRGNQIIVANVGDSRCVLSRNRQAINLSIDHKPNNPDERNRIEAAGGEVVLIGTIYRVDGVIAVSRAIGDFQFKENGMKLICNPDIHTENITEDIDFLLIASDGIWDAKTSEQVVDYVNTYLQNGTDPRAICEGLLDWCKEPGDNSTVILVQFKPGNSPTATDISSEVASPPAPGSNSGASKADTEDENKAEDPEE